jgi:hypothetical protein
VTTFVVPFEGLNLILMTPGSWPERKGKKEVQDIYLYVLEMLLIRRAGTSFCAFVGTTNVPVEEARSRAVCSFRDFKAHSSKDVAITILASSFLAVPWMALHFSRGKPCWVWAS